MTEPTPPIDQISPKALDHGVFLPRITIKFCTQCKWMLRAAYFAQELLSTFSTTLGEVALVPATGGVFTVTIFSHSGVGVPAGAGQVEEKVIWDRKRDGGFPETKMLKSLVRNVIDPERDLGHTDRALKSGGSSTTTTTTATETQKECKDC